MKKSIYFLPLLFVCLAFNKAPKSPKPKYTPPGTVWLNNNLFIDKTEITNTNWREFYYWLNHHHFPKSYCDSMLPDTTVWGNSVYTKTYYRHPEYAENPVVGITYKQAVAFCKWRSDRVNEFLYIKKNNINWSPDSIYTCPQVVIYSIPTKEEWELAASGGLDFDKFPMGYAHLTKNELALFTTLYKGPIKLLDGVCPTFQAYKGTANNFGTYNMIGNVSEIISANEFKGLNYINPVKGNLPDSTYNYKQTFTYTKPQNWLGFRCVCEVLKQ